MWYDDVIPRGKNQELVHFKTYGSYQGEWIMITKDNTNYYIYRDWYGSCSGCDALEGTENYGDNYWNDKTCKDFADNYKPFLEIKISDFERIISDDIKSLFPANIPEYYDDEVDKFIEELKEKFKEEVN